jgi:hypothetical protein
MNSHLFYRKAGSGPDGWVISPELDESMLMVTTRDQVHKQETCTVDQQRLETSRDQVDHYRKGRPAEVSVSAVTR